MTLLLQVRSILVTSEKVCFNFLGESLTLSVIQVLRFQHVNDLSQFRGE